MQKRFAILIPIGSLITYLSVRAHSLTSANPLMRLMPDALRPFCSFLTVAQVWLTPLSW